MIGEVESFIKVRSFLAGNVEIILENLVARRESSKIDSEDLFAGASQGAGSTIKWQKNYRILKRLDVLIAEKDSLGLYVSGNPLLEYQDVLKWARDTAGRDDIYLIILEKVKKIFTKSGNMMFALELCLAEQDVEGIIFPKNAMRLSGKLEEKELYWVKGNITDRSKNKKKAEESEESETVGEEGVQEYAELPKLAIEEIVRFEEGVLPLFATEDIKMAGNRSGLLERVPWLELKSSPRKELLENFDKQIKPVGDQNSSKTLETVRVLRLPSTLGKDRLVVLKSLLKTVGGGGTTPIKLEIQDSAGNWQKAKGDFWIELGTLPSDLKSFLS